MKIKKKKVSIREFVSEDSLKFQLYMLKYSNQLKDIENLEKKEIEDKWNIHVNKKINKLKKDLLKDKFSDPISQKAIKYNIEYLSNMEAPTNKYKIMKNFAVAKKEYIKSLKIRIKNNETATKNKDIILLEYANNISLSSKVSKEKFGEMLLLIIKNLATMPSFSGYSDNWKTDFYSNAIEKTLLYLNNFDEKLLSKRTGNKSNAFAYVTQIAYNAFINIINIRKDDEELIKDTISLENANLDGIRNNIVAPVGYNDRNENESEYMIRVNKIDMMDEAIIRGIEHIKISNEILDNNDCNIREIEYLNENTPEDEKNEDFTLYIEDMENKIVKELESVKITVLKIIKPSKMSLMEWEFPNEEVLNGISLIITEKKKKKIKIVEVVEEQVDEEISISDLDEFYEEW